MNHLHRFTHLVLLSILLQFGSIISIDAQNLVPNGSFEEGINCPTSAANLEAECQSWYASLIPADDFQPTPDWFHTCSEIDFMAPPDVAFGSQVPADGDGYAGVVTYRLSQNPPNYREIIGVELTEDLNVGESYLVQFMISNLHLSGYLVNNRLGFNFSTHPTYQRDDFPINHSHFAIDTIVSFSDEWSQISVVFEADSAYRYLHIGNFYDDSNTNVIIENEFAQMAYYAVDNVSVSHALNTSENNLNPTITIYPNPANSSIQIKTESELREATVSIYSTKGNKVFEERYKALSSREKIDISHVECGIYFLRLKTPKNSYYEKFIKIF